MRDRLVEAKVPESTPILHVLDLFLQSTGDDDYTVNLSEMEPLKDLSGSAFNEVIRYLLQPGMFLLSEEVDAEEVKQAMRFLGILSDDTEKDLMTLEQLRIRHEEGIHKIYGPMISDLAANLYLKFKYLSLGGEGPRGEHVLAKFLNHSDVSAIFSSCRMELTAVMKACIEKYPGLWLMFPLMKGLRHE